MNNVTVIYGAPGCGKTTRLMQILEEELAKHEANEVAFVSFTRKGSYEGAERAKARFGYRDTDLPYFRTLHSIAFREGKFSKYDMISKQDYREFSSAMGMKFTGYYTEDFFSNDDRYLFMHFLKRNNAAMAETYAYNINARKLFDVESNFARFKVHAKVSDFTDIIEAFITANKALPVKVAIIDEAQDLTTLQWKMCEVAFKDCERVYIAGDDDQAIYEWSGADVKRFLAFDAEAASTEVLSKSYRLQAKVLSFAKTISTQIARRIEKDFASLTDIGNVYFYNQLEEIQIIKGQSYYFLSRNNWFLQKFVALLKSRAKVFTLKSTLSYEPRHVEAINIYEKVRRAKRSRTPAEEAKVKLLLKPGITGMEPWYEALSFDNDTAAYYKDLIGKRANLKDESLHINTIHGVKGGEADNVVLMLDFTKAVRQSMENNPDSELRCLYVACTRAKINLHIVHSSSRSGYDSFLRMEA